jgi:CRP-like cAMP-binding protein/RsiW-degrading membrane proteinase PrsW (M82 family)
MPAWLLLLIALMPCVILLAYYLRQVRRAPEPWPRVLLCCAAGGISFGVVFWPQVFLVSLGLGHAAEAFLAFGFLEEATKLAAVLIVATAPRRWDRTSSGLVYGVAVGLGFAGVENVAYVLNDQGGALGTAVLRAVTAVPGHALHSALVGVQLGRIHRGGLAGENRKAVLLGLTLAVLAHGLYDLLLSGEGSGRLGVVPLLGLEAWAVNALFRRAIEEDLSQAVGMLRRVPVLEAAPASVLRLLAERGTRRYVPARRTVVRAGTPGEALFLVLRGQLVLSRGSLRDTAELVHLRPGSFFGEMALVTGRPYQADVTTQSDTLLLRVPSQALFEVVGQVEGLASALVRTAEKRESTQEVMPDTQQFQTLADEAVDAYERLTTGRAGLIDRLRSVTLLASLPSSQLAALADVCVELRRGPASYLVRQGREPEGMWLLVSGEVEVLRDGNEVARLVEGEFFGEVGLLTGWPATATVRSVTPIEVVLLRWVDLVQVVGVYPEVGWQMLVAVVLRMKSLRRDGNLEEAPTRERALASLLGRLGARLGLGRPMPSDRRAADLVRAFPALQRQTAAVADALAETLSVQRGDSSDLFLDPRGRIHGMGELVDVSSFQLHPVSIDGQAEGRLGGWFLSRDGLLQAVSRCPEVLRFIARHSVTG